MSVLDVREFTLWFEKALLVRLEPELAPIQNLLQSLKNNIGALVLLASQNR